MAFFIKNSFSAYFDLQDLTRIFFQNNSFLPSRKIERPLQIVQLSNLSRNRYIALNQIEAYDNRWNSHQDCTSGEGKEYHGS